MLKACKAAGLHVAVETTGNFTQEKLLQALPYIDCLLMDCKHLDADKLAAVTGGNLALIQANFAYLSKHCPDKVIVRMPVIPRFNEDCCKDVIDYAKVCILKKCIYCLSIPWVKVNGIRCKKIFVMKKMP